MTALAQPRPDINTPTTLDLRFYWKARVLPYRDCVNNRKSIVQYVTSLVASRQRSEIIHRRKQSIVFIVRFSNACIGYGSETQSRFGSSVINPQFGRVRLSSGAVI